MIIKNGKNISSVVKGNTVIDKIYKGSTKVYETNIQLLNMPTRKGTTTIETDTSILPSNMGIVYKEKK